MFRYLSILIIASTLHFALPGKADAMFARMSTEELVEQSAYVVSGTVTALQKQADGSVTGTLSVAQVLMGPDNPDTLALRITKAGGLKSSSDIEITKGQSGLWFLRALEPDLYVIDHPQRFVAPDGSAAIEAQVRQIKSR